MALSCFYGGKRSRADLGFSFFGGKRLAGAEKTVSFIGNRNIQTAE